MQRFSISEAARICEVDRRTLHRWIAKKQIPKPKVEIVEGQLRKTWTPEEIAQIKEHKKTGYWGKGINKRTGKKAKNKQVN